MANMECFYNFWRFVVFWRYIFVRLSPWFFWFFATGLPLPARAEQILKIQYSKNSPVSADFRLVLLNITGFIREIFKKILWALDFQNIKNLTGKKDTWRSFRQVPFFFYLFAFFRLLSFGRPYHIPALVICVAKTSPPESERLNAVPIIIICGASANITLFCENRTFSFPLCVWREKRV